VEGATPDSLLALHAAGYRAVIERLGPGRVLDIGCGEGLELEAFALPGRTLFGVDYKRGALARAEHRVRSGELHVAQMDATHLGLATGAVDWACSSHLIEHFRDPAAHAREVSRVLADGGTAFFLTPNRPADFENPFHLTLFVKEELEDLLRAWFDDVWVGGLDGTRVVKEDFARRRDKANRLLALDHFDLRHRVPYSWYVTAYTKVLPMAYRLVARRDTRGATGITADDFFVTSEVDETTLVLFAVVGMPRRRAPA